MIHPSLPQTKTPEALADWIKETRIDTKVHTDKVQLTVETTHDYEHKAARASQAIDKLEEQFDNIKRIFKKGTIDPFSFTVFPTKGLDVLESNRKFACDILAFGYTQEQITLYGIPWPEKEFIIYVDIQGHENEDYREAMTPEQKKAFNTMFKDY